MELYSDHPQIFDFHFANLCAVATWGDGTLSQDEYDYLENKVATWWQDNDDYDPEYTLRCYFAETLKKIHDSRSQLAAADLKDIKLLISIVKHNAEHIKGLLAKELPDELQRQALLNSFYKDYVELSLADGELSKSERNAINKTRKYFSVKSKNPFKKRDASAVAIKKITGGKD